MAFEKNELYAAELMRYFVVHKGFIRVKFISLEAATPAQDDPYNIWLLNAKYDKYSIVLITLKPLMDERFVMIGYSTLIKNIKKPGRMLHIDLSSQGRTYSDETADHIVLAPGIRPDDSILRVFPELDGVVADVENPEQEKMKISQTILDYSMNHQRKPRTLKTYISEKFSWLFFTGFILSVIFTVAAMVIELKYEVSFTAAVVICGAYYKSFITVLGEWFRILTSGFVHGGILHIIFNMFALFDLSGIISEHYGYLKGLVILIGSTIIGNIAVFAGEENAVVVGLSGGIYGLLGACIIFYWQNGYFKTPEIRKNVISILITNALISFMPQMSWLSHLGGIIAGLAFGLLLSPKTEKTFRTHVAISTLAALLAIGYLGYQNRDFRMVDTKLDAEVISVYEKMGFKSHAEKVAEKLIEYYTKGN
ncbi:MAG: rhomboid family intramembrane serine protease [Erysipelotrichaceae bacterium]|nr:rhomboid family intramembrane serine protease [Erysipelotrichaceae bacterium]